MQEDFVVEHALKGFAVHGPRQRAEAAVAQTIKGRKIRIAHRHALQSGCLSAEVVDVFSRHHAVDWFA